MSLRIKALHATKWAAVLSASVYASRMLLYFVLAAWLGPEAFGLAVRVLAIGTILVQASEFGLGAAIVQRKEVTNRHLNTAFFANLTFSVLVALIGIVVIRVWIAVGGASDFLKFLVYAMPLPIVMAFEHVQRALLQRSLDYKRIAMGTIFATIVYMVVSMGLAWLGHGVWAVLGGFYANQIVLAVWLWQSSSFRPRLDVRWNAFLDLVRFGAFHSFSGLLDALSAGVDVLLVGGRLGNAVAGLYGVGMKVGNVAVSQVSSVLNSVLFSTFSRIQRDYDALRRGYFESIRAMSVLSTIPLIVAYASAPLLPLFLGQAWGDAVLVARILCHYSLWPGLGGAIVPPLLSGLGASRTTAMVAALRVSLLVLCVSLFASMGLVWAALGAVLAMEITQIVQHKLATKALGLPIRSFFRAIGLVLASFLIATGLVHGIEHVLSNTDAGPWLTAATSSLLGLVGFLAFLWIFDRECLIKTLGLVRALAISKSNARELPPNDLVDKEPVA